MEMGDQDIFVNVAGGLRVDEPAADLAMVSAMISSFLDRPVDKHLVVFGEVGLAGEVRRVHQIGLRVREAALLGFGPVLVPAAQLEEVAAAAARGRRTGGQPQVVGVRTLAEALEAGLGPRRRAGTTLEEAPGGER